MSVFDRTLGRATNQFSPTICGLATFVAAIFVSAALLFAVQPMFTKMVLPRLGGAAAVWSVATGVLPDRRCSPAMPMRIC